MPRKNQQPTETPPRHPSPVMVALAAGGCWSVALGMLLLTDMRTQADVVSWPRIIFMLLVLVASALTFVPIQQRMALPRLALEGIGGMALLCYTLAFVPPPTGWLLSLPDTPVYLLLLVAAFWSSSALNRPFLYALRLRIIKQRARRLDTREARRQSYEIGLVVVGVILLAGLRVLTWISGLLLVLIVLTLELFFLSRFEPMAKLET